MDYQIQNDLDIFLITYNRSKNLNETFEQLFAENSPIKNLTITVIDNNSTDNTADVVKSFQTRFPNLIYKKNRYNIGGNGNIARTFEYAQKKYIWILSDDDEYNWDSWDEVVSAIRQEKDGIIVGGIDHPKLGLAQIFATTSFLPSTIYKMSNFDETVLGNMQYNISNMFPHMALSAKLINEDKEFYITDKPLVIYKSSPQPLEKTYTRGYDDSLHPYRARIMYQTGYANTLQMIKDKKKRKQLTRRRFYAPDFYSAELFFVNSQKYGNSLYNLLCIYCGLDFAGKVKFIFNWLMYKTLYKIIYFYIGEDYDDLTNEYIKIGRLRLFSVIKTNLFKFRIKNKEINK